MPAMRTRKTSTSHDFPQRDRRDSGHFRRTQRTITIIDTGARQARITIAGVADPGQDTRELDLRDYLQVLQRRKGVIALSIVIVVAAALVASFLQKPLYKASADVL